METKKMREISGLMNEVAALDDLILSFERGSLIYFRIGCTNSDGDCIRPYKITRPKEIAINLLKEDREKIAIRLKDLDIVV